ncbi:hypothetical protein ACFSWE_09620 [Leucobacter albus]|uniref:Uncharacterized protein n=1 Tax=Leucobacter albus TaxID=272210 RepID=A0ABW3TS08_9MICO
MTAPDVRTAAQEKAVTRAYNRITGQEAPWGPEETMAALRELWGAALVREGIRLTDFRGDGVYRDTDGVIWQRVEDTREAVETAIAATAARLTPTREQIAEALSESYQQKYRPSERLPVNHHDLRAADAVLALMSTPATPSTAQK